ncbi:MAG: dTMP kinase [Magnetococcus sp. DMHC-6]
MSGVFITFEGGDGSGKSTQTQLLAKRLRDLGQVCLLTREPGGCLLAEKIRALLVADHADAREAMTELLLMSAARSEHIARVIRPALARGEWVVCDRFVDSTVAYQGYGRHLDLERIQFLNHWVTQGLMPQLTIYLDIDPQLALQRVGAGGERRFEQEPLVFHQLVRQGFLTLTNSSPERFFLVDAHLPIPIVAEKIWQLVQKHVYSHL